MIGTWAVGLSFLLLLVYDSLRLGISPMPSTHHVHKVCKEHLPKSNLRVICDVGSGWGGMLAFFQKRYPRARIIGVESAVLPWLVSKVRFIKRKRVEVFYADYRRKKLPQADLYYTYLFPKGMRELASQIKRQGVTGSWLVSLTFALPEKHPEKIVVLDDLYRSKLYFYKL